MKTRELSRQLQILSSLFEKVDTITGGDMELLSHWAKYLCVLVAGFLENSLAEIYIDYSERTASPNVANFTRASLSRIHNPNSEVFSQVTQSFNKLWADSLKSFFEENGGDEAINAIMKNRHKIAHGQTSDISFHRVNGYFERATKVIEFLETQCV